MPKSTKAKLEYQKAYNAKPSNIDKRVKNNQARAEAVKAGTAHKGDGKEVDHIRMLAQGGSNAKQNLRVVPAAENRGWRKEHGDVYGKTK